ncbi:hypothetical protein PO369_00730 [Phytobacter diazotrophicus]|uniref:hypothetical protein n=1 Tax=Phytobacter diazotrophicus TaxID=395631 RepID=UPI002FFA7641
MSDEDTKNVAVTRAESTDRQHSTSPSAVSHREKTQIYRNAGLSLKKVYLGSDALSKLAEIYKIQYGEKLDVKSIDPVLLGDLLSYCINASYNLPSIRKKLPKTAPAKIGAAKTPTGQRLYRYHQMAKGTKECPDAAAMEPVFNYRNKNHKPLFPNIRHDVPDFLLTEISTETDVSCWDGPDSLDNEDDLPECEWATVEIQRLRDVKFVDKQIRQWNEVPPTLKTRKRRKLKP